MGRKTHHPSSKIEPAGWTRSTDPSLKQTKLLGGRPMPKRRNSPDVARRNFLKGAGLAGAAALTPAAAKAQVAAAPKQRLRVDVPGPKQVALETQPPVKDPVTQTSAGGDFMVD